jgi:hypothetical protein
MYKNSIKKRPKIAKKMYKYKIPAGIVVAKFKNAKRIYQKE